MGKRPNLNPLSYCSFDHCPRYDQKAIDDHNMLLSLIRDGVHPSDFEPENLEEIAQILAENRKRDARLKQKYDI